MNVDALREMWRDRPLAVKRDEQAGGWQVVGKTSSWSGYPTRAAAASDIQEAQRVSSVKSDASAKTYSAKLDKCISMLGRAVERKAGRRYGAEWIVSLDDAKRAIDKFAGEIKGYMDSGDLRSATGLATYVLNYIKTLPKK